MRQAGGPGLALRSSGAAGGSRGWRAALHRGHHFIAAAAEFERGKADVAGHQNSAAVAVKRAARIDVEVARPFESISSVADGEAQLAVAAKESDVDPLSAVLRQRQSSRYLGRPRS